AVRVGGDWADPFFWHLAPRVVVGIDGARAGTASAPAARIAHVARPESRVFTVRVRYSAATLASRPVPVRLQDARPPIGHISANGVVEQVDDSGATTNVAAPVEPAARASLRVGAVPAIGIG